MRKLLAIMLIGLTAFACTQTKVKDQFTLKGNITGINEGSIFLFYENIEGKSITDTAEIKNGEFSFQGKISEPTQAYLQLKEDTRNEKNMVAFYMEPNEMTASLTFNNFSEAQFTGSVSQDENSLLTQTNAPVMKQMEPIQEEYKAASEIYRTAMQNKQDEKTLNQLKEGLDAIRGKFDPFTKTIEKNTLDFFRTHPQSAVTANNLIFFVSSQPLDTLKGFYARLGTAMQQTKAGKNLNKEITMLEAGSPGRTAQGFTTVDINGKPISLADFKGKYVLLDFWASWCGPCRKGNPHLKAVYAQYKDKGFEIIGVSDDDSDKDAWHKAVEKDGLPWQHVLRGFDQEKRMKNEPNDNDISDKYGIHTLPTKILIDPKGVIIGRYSEEEEPLDLKLKEVFNTTDK